MIFTKTKKTQCTFEKTITFFRKCRSSVGGFPYNFVWNLIFCSFFLKKQLKKGVTSFFFNSAKVSFIWVPGNKFFCTFIGKIRVKWICKKYGFFFVAEKKTDVTAGWVIEFWTFKVQKPNFGGHKKKVPNDFLLEKSDVSKHLSELLIKFSW